MGFGGCGAGAGTDGAGCTSVTTGERARSPHPAAFRASTVKAYLRPVARLLTVHENELSLTRQLCPLGRAMTRYLVTLARLALVGGLQDTRALVVAVET